jgi:lipoprotein NlpD
MKFYPYSLLLAAPVFFSACSTQPQAPATASRPVQVEKPLASGASVPAGTATAATDPSDRSVYTVKKGDSLYRIALDHGVDYRDVANWNKIEDPGKIKEGQQLRMTPPAKVAEQEPVAVAQPIVLAPPVEVKSVSAGPGKPTQEFSSETLKREPKGGKVAYSPDALARMKNEPLPATPVEPPAGPKTVEAKAAESATSAGAMGAAAATSAAVAPAAATPAASPSAAPGTVDWQWPIQGKVLANFVEGSSKGIDIAGNPGDPVLVAAPGKVVYTGEGLRGYGKLVIVRHNAEFLSAYAHNSQILVKEGETVAKQQKIALVGSSDADSPRLHFEVRRQGKPVDPLKYLPAR